MDCLAFALSILYVNGRKVSEEKMAKPATEMTNVMDNIPYYDKWQMGEGIPIVKTFFVQDLRKVELKPWDRTGGNGAFINMEGAEGATGAYVIEIPAGKSLNPQRHLYEDMLYVLKGRGATTIWNDKGAKQTFEWHEGSLFALPLNAWHQHPARPDRRSGKYRARG